MIGRHPVDRQMRHPVDRYSYQYFNLCIGFSLREGEMHQLPVHQANSPEFVCSIPPPRRELETPGGWRGMSKA